MSIPEGEDYEDPDYYDDSVDDDYDELPADSGTANVSRATRGWEEFGRFPTHLGNVIVSRCLVSDDILCLIHSKGNEPIELSRNTALRLLQALSSVYHFTVSEIDGPHYKEAK